MTDTTTAPTAPVTCALCGHVAPNLVENFWHSCPVLRTGDYEDRSAWRAAGQALDPDLGAWERAQVVARPEGFGRDDVARARQAPTHRTNRYAAACCYCHAEVPPQEGVLFRDAGGNGGWLVKHPGCSLSSTAPAAAPVVAPQPNVRPNRYAGACRACGGHVEANAGQLVGSKAQGWGVAHLVCPQAPAGGAAAPAGTPLATQGLDLSSLPEGRYAVPGGDTRLKLLVQRPTKGQWAGWTFVKDAAVYGMGKRYGKAKPGGRYQGDVQAELEAILADPAEASRAYGRLTETCGVCGRHLEDKDSVERGIGPWCAGKLGW